MPRRPALKLSEAQSLPRPETVKGVELHGLAVIAGRAVMAHTPQASELGHEMMKPAP